MEALLTVAVKVVGSIIENQVITTNYKPAPSPPLTKEQLKELFMRFDTDHDNKLSFNEIKNALAGLGALVPAYRASSGLWIADGNNDGRVDLKELDDLVKYAYKLGYTIS